MSFVPSSFKIGAQVTPPLVSESELRSHLRLLSAFRTLRNKTSSELAHDSHSVATASTESRSRAERSSGGDHDTISPIPILHNQRWNEFLTRALYRFELYVGNVLATSLAGGQPANHFEKLNLPPFVLPTDKPSRQFFLHTTEMPPIDVAMVWREF